MHRTSAIAPFRVFPGAIGDSMDGAVVMGRWGGCGNERRGSVAKRAVSRPVLLGIRRIGGKPDAYRKQLYR
ncbi:MAG TPA: hypothetical protein PK308_09565, partial [Phycisphaerales bacterium]|nr:hypothetical protein [Phycisphaerales bacterium]